MLQQTNEDGRFETNLIRSPGDGTRNVPRHPPLPAAYETVLHRVFAGYLSSDECQIDDPSDRQDAFETLIDRAAALTNPAFKLKKPWFSNDRGFFY